MENRLKRKQTHSTRTTRNELAKLSQKTFLICCHHQKTDNLQKSVYTGTVKRLENSRYFKIGLECAEVLKLTKSHHVDKLNVSQFKSTTVFNTPHSQVESGISATPDVTHSFMNPSQCKSLVSMSATISSVGQYCGFTVPFSTYS